MSSFIPPITPAVDKWNTEQSVGAGRAWDGVAVRYNSVTVGSPYTMPNSTEPEEARFLWVMGGTSGSITLKQVNAVGQGEVTIPITVTPLLIPAASSMVTAVTGDVANIFWFS